MKVESNSPLEEVVLKGNKVVVHFNEEIVERVGEEEDAEPTTIYKYDSAEFLKACSREQRVECIIQSLYPTYGSELAAINNGGEEAKVYKAFRKTAKELADISIEVQYDIVKE